jgi:hypothetical protein
VEGNVVAAFKVLERHLFERTEQKHENLIQENLCPGRWCVITTVHIEKVTGYSGESSGSIKVETFLPR